MPRGGRVKDPALKTVTRRYRLRISSDTGQGGPGARTRGYVGGATTLSARTHATMAKQLSMSQVSIGLTPKSGPATPRAGAAPLLHPCTHGWGCFPGPRPGHRPRHSGPGRWEGGTSEHRAQPHSAPCSPGPLRTVGGCAGQAGGDPGPTCDRSCPSSLPTCPGG